MATYSGKDGIVWAATLELNVRSWSIETVCTVATGAHSSSNKWTDAEAGIKSWSGSVEVYDDDGISAAPPFVAGDEVVCQFYDGKRSFDGTMVIGGASFACDVEGGELVSSSATFVGKGALVIAAETPA